MVTSELLRRGAVRRERIATEKVVAMRMARAQGAKINELEERFGCSAGSVSRHCRGVVPPPREIPPLPPLAAALTAAVGEVVGIPPGWEVVGRRGRVTERSTLARRVCALALRELGATPVQMARLFRRPAFKITYLIRDALGDERARDLAQAALATAQATELERGRAA